MNKWKFFSYQGDPKIDGLETWFVDLMDKVRLKAKVPMIVTSGLRNSNSPIGVKRSAHEKGIAADVRSKSSFSHFRLVRALVQEGFNRIGVYVSAFACPHCQKPITDVKLQPSHIHFDKDEEKPQDVMWIGISQ